VEKTVATEMLKQAERVGWLSYGRLSSIAEGTQRVSVGFAGLAAQHHQRIQDGVPLVGRADSELLLAVPIATFEYSAPSRKIVRILLMTIRSLWPLEPGVSRCRVSLDGGNFAASRGALGSECAFGHSIRCLLLSLDPFVASSVHHLLCFLYAPDF
jgi:hypothetical protein